MGCGSSVKTTWGPTKTSSLSTALAPMLTSSPTCLSSRMLAPWPVCKPQPSRPVRGPAPAAPARLRPLLRCGTFRSRLARTPNGGVAVGPVLASAIEKLPEAIARLVKGFDPQRIIVFGSYARGEARPDSDLDLLVVVPHLGDKRETAVGMNLSLIHIIRAHETD